MIMRDYAGDIHVVGEGESFTLSRDGDEYVVVRGALTEPEGMIVIRGPFSLCRRALDKIWQALSEGEEIMDLFEVAIAPSARPQIVRIVEEPADSPRKTKRGAKQ